MSFIRHTLFSYLFFSCFFVYFQNSRNLLNVFMLLGRVKSNSSLFYNNFFCSLFTCFTFSFNFQRLFSKLNIFPVMKMVFLRRLYFIWQHFTKMCRRNRCKKLQLCVLVTLFLQGKTIPKNFTNRFVLPENLRSWSRIYGFSSLYRKSRDFVEILFTNYRKNDSQLEPVDCR